MADRGGKSDLISMSVYVRHSTDDAVLLEPAYAKREAAWVPLSLIELTPTGEPGSEAGPGGRLYTVDIPEWKALQVGFL